MGIPDATYRLQFHRQFTLRHAIDLLDYFKSLGISHLYASPLAKAAAGSLHGYDVIDPSCLNPEIGSEEELATLAQRLKERGMGLIMDIVPNHLYVGDSSNKLWGDVLENGPSSAYEAYFDIDWHPPREQLKNKVLLPFLNQQYGDALESQAIQVRYDQGAFFLQYANMSLPLNPRSWSYVLEPALEILQGHLDHDNERVLELQSILTALKHLPGVTETDPDKVKERLREKEIIKGRLLSLVEGQDIIHKAIDQSLSALNGTKGDAASFDRLEEFLTQQPYRLCFWRVANDEVNYRRFFDVFELAGIRAENPEVFLAVHRLPFHFIDQGWIQGLRVDHPDGLWDPQQYFEDLQKGCAEALRDGDRLDPQRPFYIVAEKILMGDEKLRTDWRVHGTVGYDFLNLVNGLFVREANRSAIHEIYSRFTGQAVHPIELGYQCKLLALLVSMSSELHVLARHLDRIKEQHRSSRDITLGGLRAALRGVIASFPAYRSYIRAHQNVIHEADRRLVVTAIERAKWFNPTLSASIFDFIKSVLLLEWPADLSESFIAKRCDFVMRFQQLTAPVTAIGVENTACYRYYPLASLSEVGADINRFGLPVDTFHQESKSRLATWPHTMLSTSTHDNKRGEDVRARINALSEIPDEWNESLRHWQKLNRPKKPLLQGEEVPDANEEYLFYQTLVGSWPVYTMDDAAHAHYVERIEKYMHKALREAKVHTSWINPSEGYEAAVKQFVLDVLNRSTENTFLESLTQFMPKVMRAGFFNSLSQLVLKVASPGVPDFYQGCEGWAFTLVDPDNRQPVDYAHLQSLLAGLAETANPQAVASLLASPEDGRIKLYITSKALSLRRRQREVFKTGSYLPLTIQGSKQEHGVAFIRQNGQHQVIAAVGRFFVELLSHGEGVWQDTQLVLPADQIGARYRDVFTGAEITVQEHQGRGIILMSQLFAQLPVALLERV